MKFIKDLLNRDRISLVKENQKIRIAKKNIEEEFEEYKESVDDLKSKYIALLEEKCNGFDKYLHYEEEAKKYADKVRELKKELAEAKENK
jgi:hypothetical protein